MNGFMFVVVFFASIAAVVLIAKGLKAMAASDRRKAIERNMRQQVIDADTERQVARKLLGEAGH